MGRNWFVFIAVLLIFLINAGLCWSAAVMPGHDTAAVFENRIDTVVVIVVVKSSNNPDMGLLFAGVICSDGANWYVYCANNPLLWIDPSGLERIYNDYGYYDDETGTFTNFDTSTIPSPTVDSPTPIPTPNPIKPEPAQKYTLEEGLAHYKRQQQMLILQLGDAIIQKYGSIKVPTSLAIKIGKEYLTSLEDLVAALPFITDLKAGRKGFTFYFENDTRISYDYDLNLEYYQSHPKTQFSFNAGRAFGFDDDPDIYMLSAFVLTLQSVQHIAYSKLLGATSWAKNANFAQKTYNPLKFSPEGIKKYSSLAGYPINNVDDLVSAVNSGTIKPSQLPLDYVIRDGNTLILNTRTSQALIQAGIPRSQWVGINRTGISLYENLLTGQLTRNNLTAVGVSVVKPSGGGL